MSSNAKAIMLNSVHLKCLSWRK